MLYHHAKPEAFGLKKEKPKKSKQLEITDGTTG
jgi:hypothetical protein